VAFAGNEVVPKAELDGKLSLLEESVSAGYVKQAAASAMAAAAVKAKFLADQEEREMQRLVTIVIENQVVYSI
jgi:SWI/SNF related-matrix-associated actin-dependent regulator of chromatin subfamily C